MAMAAAEPSPAAVMTWARGLTAFPAAQTPGTLCAPVASTCDPAVVVGGAAEAGEQVVVGHEPRPDEHRSPRHDLAGLELDAAQLVVLDDEAGDGFVDDADGAGDELFALVGGQGGAVGEEHDVVGPLTDEVGVGDGSAEVAGAARTPRGWSRTS